MAGYTAATDHFGLTALLLGVIMLFWQMPHFYAISIFRLKDYKAGGIPVWPARYGIKNTQIWMIAYTVLYVLAIIALAVFGKGGIAFGAVLGLLGLYWLWIEVKGLRLEKPEKWARGVFGFSLITLLVFSAMITLSPLL